MRLFPCALFLMTVPVSICSAAIINVDENSSTSGTIVNITIPNTTPEFGDLILCDVGVAAAGNACLPSASSKSGISDVLSFTLKIGNDNQDMNWSFQSDTDSTPKDGKVDTPGISTTAPKFLYMTEPSTFPLVYIPNFNEPGWINAAATNVRSGETYSITSDCSDCVLVTPEPTARQMSVVGLFLLSYLSGKRAATGR